jgi:hypothetical protein
MVVDGAGTVWALGISELGQTYVWRSENGHVQMDTAEAFLGVGLAAEMYMGLAPDGTPRFLALTREHAKDATGTILSTHVTVATYRNQVLSDSYTRPGNLVFISDFGPGLAQPSGRLWFNPTLAILEPDLTPPQTAYLAKPKALTAERVNVVTARAMDTNQIRATFAFQSDDGSPTPFGSAPTFSTSQLPDGDHRIRAWARDALGNVDPTPAECRFTIDATAPSVILSSPGAGATVRGSITVRGRIEDAHPKSYRVLVGRQTAGTAAPATWDTLSTGIGSTNESDLAVLHSDSLSGDGTYVIRLEAEDVSGLRASTTTSIRVDNFDPPNPVVSPVTVERGEGGVAYSEDLNARLEIPPGFFDSLATVRLDPIDGTVLTGAVRGLVEPFRAYDISWGGVVPHAAKFGILDMRAPTTSDSLGIGVVQGDSLVRLGSGSHDPEWSAAVSVRNEGRYVLQRFGTSSASTPGSLALTLSPRILDLRTTRPSYLVSTLAVSVTTPGSNPLKVRIYNRAGRLIRDLASSSSLSPGIQVYRWDGNDESGDAAPSGLYLALIESGSASKTATFSLIR